MMKLVSRRLALIAAASLFAIPPTFLSAQDRTRRPTPAPQADDGSGVDQQLPAPLTIRAAGVYKVSTGGEALLRMNNATTGRLSLGGSQYAISADPATGKLSGKSGGDIVAVVGERRQRQSTVNLTFTPRTPTTLDMLTGTVDGKAISLTRLVTPPIPASELSDFDRGPPGDMKAFLDSAPDYAKILKDTGIDPDGKMFWYNFGPVTYRGRVDGSARVMIIASDPGPTECLPFVRRPMVGDAGQRVQGFLAKLGLNRSYVLVNAYAYAMRPSFVKKGWGEKILNENVGLEPGSAQLKEFQQITNWRHELFTRIARGSKLQAIVAMGGNARPAYQRWIKSLPANDPIRKIPVFNVQHPSAVDRNPGGPRPDTAIAGWQKTIPELRKIITPDAGQRNDVENYGEYFTENDYARVPRWDLPKEAPNHIGDDSWGRAEAAQHNNAAKRPSPDDFKSLVFLDRDGTKTTYVFENGKFVPAKTTRNGQPFKVDANGRPVR